MVRRNHKWELTTLAFLATVYSYPDAVLFKNTKFNTGPGYVYKVNDAHDRKLRETSVRLDTLRRVIDRHQGNWSPLLPAERERISAMLKGIEAQVLATGGNQTLDEPDGGKPASA
jgi:hypothetical protein